MRLSAFSNFAGIVKLLFRHNRGVDQIRQQLPSCAQGQAVLALSSCFKSLEQIRWFVAGRDATWRVADATCTAWPTAAAAQQPNHHRSMATTSASHLDQQQYWKAIEEYACQRPECWREHLRKAGLEPLSEQQQICRYAGNWLGEPPGLNWYPAFCQTSHLTSLLRARLTPYQLQLLLNGDIDNPALLFSPKQKKFRCSLQVGKLLEHYSFDHIIPTSKEGMNHPANYFLMVREVNSYFGNSWTAKKVAYIGTGAALAAGRLHGFVDSESMPHRAYGKTALIVVVNACAQNKAKSHMAYVNGVKLHKSLRQKLHIPCTSTVMQGPRSQAETVSRETPATARHGLKGSRRGKVHTVLRKGLGVTLLLLQMCWSLVLML